MINVISILFVVFMLGFVLGCLNPILRYGELASRARLFVAYALTALFLLFSLYVAIAADATACPPEQEVRGIVFLDVRPGFVCVGGLR